MSTTRSRSRTLSTKALSMLERSLVSSRSPNTTRRSLSKTRRSPTSKRTRNSTVQQESDIELKSPQKETKSITKKEKKISKKSSNVSVPKTRKSTSMSTTPKSPKKSPSTTLTKSRSRKRGSTMTKVNKMKSEINKEIRSRSRTPSVKSTPKKRSASIKKEKTSAKKSRVTPKKSASRKSVSRSPSAKPKKKSRTESKTVPKKSGAMTSQPKDISQSNSKVNVTSSSISKSSKSNRSRSSTRNLDRSRSSSPKSIRNSTLDISSPKAKNTVLRGLSNRSLNRSRGFTQSSDRSRSSSPKNIRSPLIMSPKTNKNVKRSLPMRSPRSSSSKSALDVPQEHERVMAKNKPTITSPSRRALQTTRDWPFPLDFLICAVFCSIAFKLSMESLSPDSIRTHISIIPGAVTLLDAVLSFTGRDSLSIFFRNIALFTIGCLPLRLWARNNVSETRVQPSAITYVIQGILKLALIEFIIGSSCSCAQGFGNTCAGGAPCDNAVSQCGCSAERIIKQASVMHSTFAFLLQELCFGCHMMTSKVRIHRTMELLASSVIYFNSPDSDLVQGMFLTLALLTLLHVLQCMYEIAQTRDGYRPFRLAVTVAHYVVELIGAPFLIRDLYMKSKETANDSDVERLLTMLSSSIILTASFLLAHLK